MASESRTATGSPGPSQLSFNAINGWRGPGALAIALAHLVVFSNLPGTRHIGSISVVVDLFFVLSGMLIAQAYGAKLTRGSAVLPYVIRRFGRIWPLHAVLLGVLVAYELAKLALTDMASVQFSTPAFDPAGGALVSAIPTNLLLIHSLGIHGRDTWNFPSWSLSVEFVTYIVFAVFCLMGTARRRWLSVAIVAVSLLILAGSPFGMRSAYDYGIFRCFAGFFAGALTYELIATRALPRWPLPTLVEIAALVATGVWMVCGEATSAQFAAPLIFSGLVVVFVAERGAISRLLRTGPMQIFAEWSYAIYIVHAVVLMFFLGGLRLLGRLIHTDLVVPQLFVPPDPALPTLMVQIVHIQGAGFQLLTVVVYLAAVMGAAYAGHRFIETPAREIFNRLAGVVSGRRKKAAAAAARGPAAAWVQSSAENNQVSG